MQGEIVRPAKTRTNFVIGVVVVETLKVAEVHRQVLGESAHLGIVEGRAVDAKLRIVEDTGGERVVQGQDVVGGLRLDLLLVQQVAERPGGGGIVPNGAKVQRGPVIGPVIEAKEAAVFTDSDGAQVRVFVDLVAIASGLEGAG